MTPHTSKLTNNKKFPQYIKDLKSYFPSYLVDFFKNNSLLLVADDNNT